MCIRPEGSGCSLCDCVPVGLRDVFSAAGGREEDSLPEGERAGSHDGVRAEPKDPGV